jgi:hypothetical protein
VSLKVNLGTAISRECNALLGDLNTL